MGALQFVGKYYSTKELIEKLLEDKVFYKNSGGGITLSGGEATMQLKFLVYFLKELKPSDINVCLETYGYFNSNTFFNDVMTYINLIYFDLKLFDENQLKLQQIIKI
jgi:pyruvate formate lyase activating enzyme